MTAETATGIRSVIGAEAFLDSLGVDTHIPYTDGGYANLANVVADLSYLGISAVRDAISDGQNGSAPLSSFETMAAAEITFNAVVGEGAMTPALLSQQLGVIDQLERFHPGDISAVEGPNEINNSPITWTPADGVTETGLQAAVDYQEALYAAVHSDPKLAGVPVEYFTGYDASGLAVGPDPATTPGLADIDVQHPYPQSTDVAYWVAPSTALPNEAGTPGPSIYTETGFTTNTVSQLTQAQGDLNIYMDSAKDGVLQTFLYQLMDAYQPGSPQGDDGYGLFDPNGNPKLAATAIHNLTTILADPDAAADPSFAPVAAGFTVTGLPSDGDSLDIEKSDGSHDFVVWNETSGTQAVTVDLGAEYQSATVFDPLAGTTPIATYSDVSSVPLTLNGSPLIVQVAPGAVMQATPPVVTLGTGANTLALKVSQDAWNGDAQFTISVDGQQVGGVQTVDTSAIHGLANYHAAGTSVADQTFDVEGNWTGDNTVTIDFLNDAYAGTAETDRNLYVDSAAIDGQAIAGSNLAEMSSGSQSFSFTTSSAAVGAGTTTTETSGGDMSSTTGNGSVSSTGGSGSAPPAVSLGSGADTLTLQISQDAYLGSAEFTVSVNGVQIGGVQTVDESAVHGLANYNAAGVSVADQTFDIEGDWSGANTITIDFLNDAYAGTAETDRNLYVDSASINGQGIAGSRLSEMSGGSQSFSFTVPTSMVTTGASTTTSSGNTSTTTGSGTTSTATSSGSTPPAVSLGTGPDTLGLQISQDAYLGSAQFVVLVDGLQVGGVQTVDATAVHGLANYTAAGTGVSDQTFDVTGDWTGATTVTVDFLNDAYAGTPQTDRNLYVDSATINGQTIAGRQLGELSSGPQSFSFIAPAATSSTSQPDLGLFLSAAGGAGAQWSIDGGALSSVVQPTSNASGQGFDLGSLSAGTHTIAVTGVALASGGSAQSLTVLGASVANTTLTGISGVIAAGSTQQFTVTIP